MQSEASWFYCPYKRGRDPVIALYVTCAEDDGFVNIEFREDAVSCIFAWPIGKQVYTATQEATPATSVTSIRLCEMVTEELVDVPWQDFAIQISCVTVMLLSGGLFFNSDLGQAESLSPLTFVMCHDTLGCPLPTVQSSTAQRVCPQSDVVHKPLKLSSSLMKLNWAGSFDARARGWHWGGVGLRVTSETRLYNCG